MQKYYFWDFRQLLKLEKERSERYNHYFVIFGLCLGNSSDKEFDDFLQSQMRGSDYVFRVNPEDCFLPEMEQIGILLPETDPSGAGIFKNRLERSFAWLSIARLPWEWQFPLAMEPVRKS